MAQAERITTAIRELLSRGEPPRSTSPRSAHTEFIAALAGNAPHAIHSKATAADLERRAEHLQRVFTALHVYVTALIADFAQNFPGSTLDQEYLDSLFQQFSADAVGIIRNAAAEMRAHENWRVS
jgi:hypothetical protein